MNDISREYGAALYELAAEEGLARELLAETETVRAALGETPLYIRLLSSPKVSKDERERAIGEAFDGAHPYLLRFLRMMVSLGYARELCDALSEYKRLFKLKKTDDTRCSITPSFLRSLQSSYF